MAPAGTPKLTSGTAQVGRMPKFGTAMGGRKMNDVCDDETELMTATGDGGGSKGE